MYKSRKGGGKKDDRGMGNRGGNRHAKNNVCTTYDSWVWLWLMNSVSVGDPGWGVYVRIMYHT